jgi:hypothetical protein
VAELAKAAERIDCPAMDAMAEAEAQAGLDKLLGA